MLNSFVFGIAIWQEQGHRIIDHLKSVNFSDHAISAFFPATTASGEEAKLHPPKNGAKTISGRCIGEALGWMARLHGETSAAPMSDGDSQLNLTESISSGLMAMGIPGQEALWYGNSIRYGHILISVHTTTAEDVLLAGEILRNNAAQDICITGKTHMAPVPDIGAIWRPQARRELVSHS